MNPPQEIPTSDTSLKVRSAILFVILLSLADLFADFTYESARSIAGPFLALLGASGTVIGVTAGSGELMGYALRIFSGTAADRTHRYWLVAISGYVINLFSVPFLALSGHWTFAAALLITERSGRAIRAPARDAMLSHATHKMGRGWGFGLHEAMDQAGAVIGPLVIAAVVFAKNDYRLGFALLAIPAVLCVSILVLASRLYPHPRSLEIKHLEGGPGGFSSAFWVFLAACGLVGAGYADFPLMAYHLQKTSRVIPAHIPLFYSLAMGTYALAALGFGRFYDRKGIRVLVFGVALSCFCAPLIFWGTALWVLLGVGLWGIGLGAVESLMRAAAADMSPADRRGTAYGIFNGGYGALWFLGSALMGWLYDHSLPGLVIFSILTQLAAIPLVLLAAERSLPVRAFSGR